MPDPILLPSVTITAKRLPAKKYRTAREQVNIYPRGVVDKSKMDSLMKMGREKVIGQPMKRMGMSDMYSPDQGDMIKSMIKK